MVSKTLFLTGGMPKHAKRNHINRAMNDKTMTSMHMVGHDFVDDEVTSLLVDLFLKDDRRWNTIKLGSCQGRIDSMVAAVLASNARRLLLSLSNAETCMKALSLGLVKNRSLMSLGIHDVVLSKSSVHELSSGLQQNTSLMDLSFANSEFSHEATLELSESLQGMTTLQHLSFQGCSLHDNQCHDIVTALTGNTSLLELSLDGNSCSSAAMKALSCMIPTSNLLVLDVSSQKLPRHQGLDVTSLAQGLVASRLRCLQLSNNRLSEEGLSHLAGAIASNQSLRVLHMAWCSLSNAALSSLSSALRVNTTLQKVVLYECFIDNEGLSCLTAFMREMKGLRQLDLGGTQIFDDNGVQALLNELEQNVDIEEITLPPCQAGHKVTFYCDANQGGRRFLRHKDSAPAALWPAILSRAQELPMASLAEPMEESGSEPKRRRLDDDTRRAGVLYHLVKNATS